MQIELTNAQTAFVPESLVFGAEHFGYNYTGFRGFDRFLDRECRDAAGNGHAKAAQDLLALVLVDLHEVSLRGWLFSPASQGELP